MVQARRKAREIMARHEARSGRILVAAEFPPPPPPGGEGGGLDHEQGSSNLKREIPEEYNYDPKALKPLAKMLWSMSVALGHALTANKQFTRLKSATISPDGLVGGRGYVMGVKDVRKALYDACEAMSAVCDTVHDEINAPHWKPRLAQLEKEDQEDVERLVGDAERILDDPEGDAEEDMEEAETHGAPWHHPAVQKDNSRKKNSPPASSVPNGGERETNPTARPLRPDMRKESNTDGLQQRIIARFLQGNSSLPVETIPGGPRVDHLDRGDSDQTGPFGTYNQDDDMELSDQWRKDDGFGSGYNYPSDWDNDLHEKQGSAAIPDGEMDPTPTQGYDFGIGDGNGNDAHGQGAGGYGEGNPGAPDTNPGGGTGNRGVYGPQALLPSDPAGKKTDDSAGDPMAVTELEVGGRMPKHAYSYERVKTASTGTTELPQDVAPTDVARADYYDGPKDDNMQDVAPSTVGATKLPGEQMPAKQTPATPRPAHNQEHMFAQGELPGDQTKPSEMDRDLSPSTGYSYQDADTPYIRWDYDTAEMRSEPTYQRGPIQGPYVHNDLVERPSNG